MPRWFCDRVSVRPAAPAASRWAAPLFLALAVLLGATGTARADTVVVGQVLDVTTGAPVAGAMLQLQSGASGLATGYSAADGRFQVLLVAKAARDVQRFTLVVSQQGYETASKPFTITDGRTDVPSYGVALLPKGLGNCTIAGDGHLVLVGQFTKQAGAAGDLERLSRRVNDALTFSLIPTLQQKNIRPELLPRLVACWEAEPRSPQLAGQYARALRADALVYGRISSSTRGPTRVDLTAFVAAGYGVAPLPPSFESRGVDLDSPEATRLDAKTQAAIVTALAAGYEKEGRAAECVELANVARKLADGAFGELATLRERCQKATGTAGLLKGGTK